MFKTYELTQEKANVLDPEAPWMPAASIIAILKCLCYNYNMISFPTPERPDFDPDIAELMYGNANSPINPADAEVETEPESLFERDKEKFHAGIALWEDTLEKELTPTPAELPAGYVFKTNTDLSPYNPYLVEDLEMQRRGSPLLITRQATVPSTGKVIEEFVAVHSPIGVAAYNGDTMDHIALRLAFTIGDGHFFNRLLSHKWRAKNSDYPASQVAEYADGHGLAERSFMTSLLLLDMKSYGSRVPMYEQQRSYYEQLATELDDSNHRKFLPLAPEEFGGLVLTALHDTFGAIPELNDKFGLTRPFPPTEQPED